MKKIITFSIIIFALFFVITKVDASSVILSPSKHNVNIGEQFYVDIFNDPQDSSINGIDGTIHFNVDHITFVRAEEGKSIISLWIERPTNKAGSISFAGIIPSGFSGVIDPFNSIIKKPGLITRLIFEAKRSGEAIITTDPFTISDNDGEGTTTKTLPVSTSIAIDNIENKIIYDDNDTTPPTLEAYVTRDNNLFDNRYTLVFQAIDKESGIDGVMIKEGNHDWKKIESPYLLEDQSRHSIINLRATNFSGYSYSITIDSLPYNFMSLYITIIFIVIVLLIYIISKKKNVFKK